MSHACDAMMSAALLCLVLALLVVSGCGFPPPPSIELPSASAASSTPLLPSSSGSSSSPSSSASCSSSPSTVQSSGPPSSFSSCLDADQSATVPKGGEGDMSGHVRVDPLGPVRCPYCLWSGRYPSNLAEHIRAVHKSQVDAEQPIWANVLDAYLVQAIAVPELQSSGVGIQPEMMQNLPGPHYASLAASPTMSSAYSAPSTLHAPRSQPALPPLSTADVAPMDFDPAHGSAMISPPESPLMQPANDWPPYCHGHGLQQQLDYLDDDQVELSTPHILHSYPALASPSMIDDADIMPTPMEDGAQGSAAASPLVQPAHRWPAHRQDDDQQQETVDIGLAAGAWEAGPDLFPALSPLTPIITDIDAGFSFLASMMSSFHIRDPGAWSQVDAKERRTLIQ